VDPLEFKMNIQENDTKTRNKFNSDEL
jgi:hypothetical protein